MVALRAIIPGTTPRLIRDRDANAGDRSASDGVLEERRFYCQNWRHDVVMLLDSSGGRAEGYRYSAYGVPFGIPRADVNGDGAVDLNDFSILANATGNSLGDPGYVVTADINLDGTVDSSDFAILSVDFGATLGRGALSSMTTSGNGGNRNRIGYAGYQFDDAANKYHVRNRVYDPLNGRWLRRDPLGYVDGPNLYEYARGRATVSFDPLGLKTTIETINESGVMECNPQACWGISKRPDCPVVAVSKSGEVVTTCNGGEEGEDDPLVLIALIGGNNFGGNWNSLSEYERELADEHRKIRLFGSDSDWFNQVAGWLRREQRERCMSSQQKAQVVIAGHSHGGDAGRKQARSYGENVDLLFLFDPIGKPWHRKDRFYSVSGNVLSAVSWYQRTTDVKIMGLVLLQGYKIAPGENILFDDHLSALENQSYRDATSNQMITLPKNDGSHGSITHRDLPAGKDFTARVGRISGSDGAPCN